MLLPSGPDKVHGVSLRRTQTKPGEAVKEHIHSVLIILVFTICVKSTQAELAVLRLLRLFIYFFVSL